MAPELSPAHDARGKPGGNPDHGDAATSPDAPPRATSGHPVWLHVGTLLDGTRDAPRRDAHVVYDDRAILFVGTGGRTPPRPLVRPGQAAPDLDDESLTLLPGLTDTHTHLFLEGAELDLTRRTEYLGRPPEELLAAARSRLERLVRLGVTAVREAGDRDGVGLALSRLYASGDAPSMPYIDSPGPAIHRRGRYGGFMGEPLEDCASVRACVEERVRAGADRIKLIPTGIINFKQGRVTVAPQLTADEVAELVSAARSFGRQTLAHASGDDGIQHAIDGGVDSVEHGFFLRDDQLARMRDRQIAWVPTFAPVQEQLEHADVLGWHAHVADNLRRILDGHAAMLRKAHALGVLVLAGSDAGSCGVAHGFGLLEEMELLERAGLPALAVVNAATGIASRRLAFKQPIGEVREGYLPRFILTRHSPLESLGNLRKPRIVVFDGEVLDGGAEVSAAGM